MLAVGAAINWVAAMLVVSDRAEVATASLYARAIEPVVTAIVRAFS